ncbi:hydrogen peroxide-inducible genes activator [Prosthecomicrobium pneumaticum]|uniref:LysR family hydrogen peroxide-inducible transcriptional activator n=1 Tax=Prosthecomicrobium pneumaticum TaxID=81895 RepID=A0A7W9FK13_9HYPH|nr:hydrogen peroxide-inducible genes activator [Prosthecomicrobium pneumaticum]MBB5752065.1 LysR family hydrogen peroxide-inducible transcriptional activator [Prosthecomicrobium pneumaticum]
MAPLPSPQQLRYLLALNETQHFGRAAEECGVTQSTLSAGLTALERQLDAALLDRSRAKRAMFTPLGLELVDRARVALAALEAFVEAADVARQPMSGPLRLGVIPTIGPFLLPRLMPALRSAFPNLKPVLREDTTERLVARLEANRLDALLLAFPCSCSRLETVPIAQDALLAALPAGHRLADLERIPVRALEGERLLLMEDGHCLRDQVVSACALSPEDAPARDEFAATSLHTLVQMVASGFGVTLLPEMAVAAGVTAGTDLVVRPLVGRRTERTIALAWRPNAPRAADYRALAALLGGDAAAAA